MAMEFPQWVKELRGDQWGIYCQEIDTFFARETERAADEALAGISAAHVKLTHQDWVENESPEAIAAHGRALRKQGHASSGWKWKPSR